MSVTVADSVARQVRDVDAGSTIRTPITDRPFGPAFSFEGPEGHPLTAHGG
ncbi:hypothetical protein [Streptomyces noursei]|uniref:hypothetical protein n=1 Tax=Streptomyces noursei TaxID=1971 RepID=UPI0023B7CA38|nr:hypothetical protein [Streptomyces noursei]